MAYYDNLAAEQPWSLRAAFGGDAWIPDLFARETEALTKVLQSSFAAGGDFLAPEAAPIQTPTPSGGSENEAPPPPPRRCGIPPRAGGRVGKRKRVSKRVSSTTFITADAANFRQMVQQVTGVRFAGIDGLVSPPSAFEAEPLLGAAGCGGGLPTLDTSAFLLNVSDSSPSSQPRTPASVGGGAAPEYYFDSFCSFPTLESWKAVE